MASMFEATVIRRARVAIVAGALSLTLSVLAQKAAQQPQQMTAEQQAQLIADMALASRFSQIAQATMGGQRVEDVEFKEYAAMMEAASRLDTNNPRYLRNLVEAQ